MALVSAVSLVVIGALALLAVVGGWIDASAERREGAPIPDSGTQP